MTDRPNPVTTPENLRPTTPQCSTSDTNASEIFRTPNVEPNKTDDLIRNLSLPSTSQIASPEDVRPFLKSGPRKTLKSNNRKMSSAVITDTPEKDKIEEKEQKNKPKKPNVRKMTTKQNIKKLNSKTHDESSDSSANISLHDDSSVTSSDDEINLLELRKQKTNSHKEDRFPEDKNYCIVCNGHYSKSKVEWYQCKICDNWAHESCGIKGAKNLFCHKCF